MTPAYKVDDYIIVRSNAAPSLINKTVRIAEIVGNAYLIDLLDGGIYKPWLCQIADKNSELNKARTILYAKN